MKALRIAPLVACLSLVAISAHGDLIAHFPLDETSGAVATDVVGGRNGTVQNADAWLSPGLGFDGAQAVSTPAVIAAASGSLSVALWVNVDETTAGQYFVEGGIFGVFIFQNKIFGEFNRGGSSSGGSSPLFEIKNGLSTGSWHHVAFTTDGSTLKTYFDGVKTSERTEAVTFGTSLHGLKMGEGASSGTFRYRGGLRDVRVYDAVLSEAELSEVVDSMSSAYRGLWLGRATLDEVKDARSGQWGSAPEFSQNVLMHVDQNGTPRLLREAIVMRTRVTAPDVPEQVIVTDPAQASNYDGVTLRGGKMIGQRLSAATMPIASGVALLTRSGSALEASINLPADHPSNPFRHKFHPDLASGRMIDRVVRVELDGGDTPSDGSFQASIEEVVTGLHTNTLQARGAVTFTRVSTSGLLD